MLGSRFATMVGYFKGIDCMDFPITFLVFGEGNDFELALVNLEKIPKTSPMEVLPVKGDLEDPILDEGPFKSTQSKRRSMGKGKAYVVSLTPLILNDYIWEIDQRPNQLKNYGLLKAYSTDGRFITTSFPMRRVPALSLDFKIPESIPRTKLADELRQQITFYEPFKEELRVEELVTIKLLHQYSLITTFQCINRVNVTILNPSQKKRKSKIGSVYHTRYEHIWKEYFGKRDSTRTRLTPRGGSSGAAKILAPLNVAFENREPMIPSDEEESVEGMVFLIFDAALKHADTAPHPRREEKGPRTMLPEIPNLLEREVFLLKTNKQPHRANHQSPMIMTAHSYWGRGLGIRVKCSPVPDGPMSAVKRAKITEGICNSGYSAPITDLPTVSNNLDKDAEEFSKRVEVLNRNIDEYLETYDGVATTTDDRTKIVAQGVENAQAGENQTFEIMDIPSE
uniref:Uncharacterized protein n=1 Tax=Cannabis sativa TaxID=3483 RepID=A0A803PTM3_CANSA